MLSWCQTTYQDAGLHMFLIFQLFVLSFLVSQGLMRIPSSSETEMKYWKQQWQLHNRKKKKKRLFNGCLPHFSGPAILGDLHILS